LKFFPGCKPKSLRRFIALLSPYKIVAIRRYPGANVE
jgi:hypothetical protein